MSRVRERIVPQSTVELEEDSQKSHYSLDDSMNSDDNIDTQTDELADDCLLSHPIAVARNGHERCPCDMSMLPLGFKLTGSIVRTIPGLARDPFEKIVLFIQGTHVVLKLVTPYGGYNTNFERHVSSKPLTTDCPTGYDVFPRAVQYSVEDVSRPLLLLNMARCGSEQDGAYVFEFEGTMAAL